MRVYENTKERCVGIRVENFKLESITDIAKAIYNKYDDPHNLKKIVNSNVETIIADVTNNDEYTFGEKLIFLAQVEDLRRKKNLDEIIKGALLSLNEESNISSINADWLLDFYDKASKIASEDFKPIWSRILAEEANAPNTISKRLLHNLFMMTSADAENFINLSRFCFFDAASDKVHPIIFYRDDPDIYNAFNVTIEELNNLENFSLIKCDFEYGFSFKSNTSNTIKLFRYTNHKIEVYAERIKCGNVQFTKDGEALFEIIQKRNHSQVLDITAAKWREYGYDVKINNK